MRLETFFLSLSYSGTTIVSVDHFVYYYNLIRYKMNLSRAMYVISNRETGNISTNIDWCEK